jgi:hypothetical protein
MLLKAISQLAEYQPRRISICYITELKLKQGYIVVYEVPNTKTNRIAL